MHVYTNNHSQKVPIAKPMIILPWEANSIIQTRKLFYVSWCKVLNSEAGANLGLSMLWPKNYVTTKTINSHAYKWMLEILRKSLKLSDTYERQDCSNIPSRTKILREGLTILKVLDNDD